jgi:hypothetical protein
MSRKDVLEFRAKYGRLKRGWRKILEAERWRTANEKRLKEHGLAKAAPRMQLAELKKQLAWRERQGKRLSELGANEIKFAPSPRVQRRDPPDAKFVPGGLPSLGKQR